MNVEVTMFYRRRIFASLLVTIVVALTVVFAQSGAVAVAQDGVSKSNTSDTTGPDGAGFVGADIGMPALYACQYGDWGCAELAGAATFIGTDSGMPALYACQYGHWGCAESAVPATFVGADGGMPALYACQYGHWGCE
jgi:hypothetical protein